LLQQAAESRDLRIKITCFSHVSAEDQQLYPLLKDTLIVSAISTMSIRQTLADFVKSRGVKRKKMREAFGSCDIFFEIAGGDSFSDIYGIDRLKVANEVHRKIRSLKKPLVFLPQTIGPFKTEEAKVLAKESLSGAKLIFARDPLSYSEASKMAKSSHIVQTVDMACFMDYEKAKSSCSNTARIGINPSGLLWNGGYTGENQFNLIDDYKKTIRAILKRLGKMKVEPVLVPHVLSGPGFQIEDDYRVCRELKSEFPFCSIAPFFYTPIEAKSFISGLDLLIGSRMHACISAYTSGVPVYPLSYSRKFSGLFQVKLDWHHGADLTVDRVDVILEMLEGCISQLSELQTSMPRRCDVVLEFEQPLVKKLRSLMQDVQPCA
jgi:polysaccharide pyruvyl transferase WcaK-like protein